MNPQRKQLIENFKQNMEKYEKIPSGINDGCCLSYMDKNTGFVGSAGSKGGLKMISRFGTAGVDVTDILKGGEVYDVLTFPKKKLAFFYESTEKVLYKIDPNDKVSAMMATHNNDIPSQTLRRDREENNLFFFYKEDKFAVLQDVNEDGYSNMLQFGGFSANQVSDFRAVGQGNFIIMTKNGNLSVFEFSAKHISKVSEINLNYGDDDLEFCTFDVCNQDKYLVVAAGDKLTSEKKNLFLLEILPNKKLKLLDRKNFEGEGKNSMFFRLVITYLEGTVPIVICYEKGKNFDMVAYNIYKDVLKRVAQIENFHSAPFLTIENSDGMLRSIDVEGFLYDLPLTVTGTRTPNKPKITSIKMSKASHESEGNFKNSAINMSGGVLSFDREKNSSYVVEEANVGAVIKDYQVNFANNYNSRRSMVIDFNFPTSMCLLNERDGIMGCTEPGNGIFYYHINDSGTLDFKILASVGEYSDLVYYKTKKLAFSYDPKIKFLIKIDCERNLVSLTKLINPTLANKKALAKDIGESILFVNTDEHEITMFSNLKSLESEPKEIFKISDIPGDRLISMKTMYNSRLVTLSKDGHLNLYRYNDSSASLLSRMNMNYGRPQKLREVYVSMGVSDNFTNFIVLAAKKKSKLSKIVLLGLDDSHSFMCMSSQSYKKTAKGSKVYDIGIRAEDKNMPVVYAFMSNGERKLLILGIINKSLFAIDNYPNFHKDKHGMSELMNGFLYGVEATGTLRIVKL